MQGDDAHFKRRRQRGCSPLTQSGMAWVCGAAVGAAHSKVAECVQPPCARQWRLPSTRLHNATGGPKRSEYPSHAPLGSVGMSIDYMSGGISVGFVRLACLTSSLACSHHHHHRQGDQSHCRLHLDTAQGGSGEVSEGERGGRTVRPTRTGLRHPLTGSVLPWPLLERGSALRLAAAPSVSRRSRRCCHHRRLLPSWAACPRCT